MTTNQTIDGVPRDFVREGRYIVVKPDCEDDLRTGRLRNYIEEMCFHTPDCVVVEADWPEYEKVWGMIEARVTGRPTELDVAKATIDHLRDDLEETRLLAADQLLKINRLQARISDLEAAQPQGDPVVLMELVENKIYGGMHIAKWNNPGGLKEGFHRLYAEQPAPVAVDTLKEDLAHDTGYRNGVMHGYKLATEGSEDDYQKCVSRLTSEINAGRRYAKAARAAVVMPSVADMRGLVTKASREADLIPGANYYTAAELSAEYVVSEIARLNPSL